MENTPMNRLQMRQVLADLDLSQRADELPHRERMLGLLDSTADCFLRSTFPAHFTGSALVVDANGERALLHHHRNLDRWLQFGGHCDGEPDLVRVAAREALEESGIEGLIAASAKPFDLDIHPIPARRDEPAHEHFDVRYMFIAPGDARPALSGESYELRWFLPAELLALPIDEGLRRMVNKWQALVARRKAHR